MYIYISCKYVCMSFFRCEVPSPALQLQGICSATASQATFIITCQTCLAQLSSRLLEKPKSYAWTALPKMRDSPSGWPNMAHMARKQWGEHGWIWDYYSLFFFWLQHWKIWVLSLTYVSQSFQFATRSDGSIQLRSSRSAWCRRMSAKNTFD